MSQEQDDLDRLAAELDAGRRETRAVQGGLDGWLALVAERRASDLLLLPGEPPALRVQGRIVRTDGPPLDGIDIEEMVLPELPPHAQRLYREHGMTDAARRVPGVGRFRINLHHERGRAAAAIRLLPTRVPALASLDLPPGTDAISKLPRGLVLIGGATGSGKTTTVAAIVDEINRRDAKHIITIEDPIEYEHTNQKCVIQQMEIGADAPDFPTALRSVLRQAPDVIVIGEMRDPETMHIALTAGETGHLVLTTLHTSDVPSSISRLTDSFPEERQPTIRQEVAAALSAIYVQALLPRAGGGRVPVAELLVLGYGARQHVRKNTLHQLHQEITISRKHGSFTLEDTLARLVKSGVLDHAEALLRANHPEEFEHALPHLMRAFRHLLLAGVILALEFVTLEAALRFHGGSEASPGFQSLFMPDPRIGHRLRPGARTRYTTVEFSTDLAINDQGVRDDAPIGPKAPDERRVVILGDSLVLAVQVPLAATFAKRLEAKLQQADPAHRWRVINAGVQGYGPVEDWLFYDHVAAAFDPDVVLTVLFVGNDAVEANDNEAKMDARGAPVRADVSDQAVTWVRRVVRSSMVLQLARVRADQLSARVAGPGGERPLLSYLAEPAPEVVHGLDVTRRAVGHIAAKATAAGARPMLVLMPARFQTDDADYGRLAAIVHENGETLVRQAATERFREGLAPLSLPTLDLLPVLEAQPERTGLFFQRNVHLTPRGHDVVAGALADFLVRTNAVGPR